MKIKYFGRFWVILLKDLRESIIERKLEDKKISNI